METASLKTEAVARPSASSGSGGSQAMVVDKRPPHRPGGCIGIFFHLFDWNHRLAKKRFFSRKLLPQDRTTKRISKKFTNEERVPAAKPLAIAAENQGGFPNPKRVEAEKAMAPPALSSSRDKGMSAPGLVARLMGLESMPATARHDNKPRKAVENASSSNGCYADRSGVSSSPLHEPELGLDRGRTGHAKLGMKPQKLQKLGFFDRRPSVPARVGSEAMLFNKGILARSRKQHYKLASPVKSPRLAGRRSSARLMEAATRILEPGLHSRNRSRSALTYLAPFRANVGGMDTTIQRPNVSAAFVSPCHNCGSLVEVPDLTLKANESMAMEYGPSSTTSDLSSSSSCSGFDEVASNPQVIPEEKKVTPSLAVQAKSNLQRRSHCPLQSSRQFRNESQDQSKLPVDVTGSTSGLKQNNMRQNEMPLIREKVVPVPKLGSRYHRTRESSSFNECKNFIASNRNPNNCMQTKTTRALGNRRIEIEGNAWERKSLVCRRRPLGNNNQSENVAVMNSNFLKKASTSSVSNGRVPGLNSARSIRGNFVKGEIQKMGRNKCGSGNKNGNILIPAGNPPVRNSSMSYASVVEMRKTRADHGHGGISQSPALTTESKSGNLSSERALDERIDALSTLLKQKIRELTCSERDELEGRDGVHSLRPTAAILEELISALSAVRPIPLKREDDFSFDIPVQVEMCSDGKGPSEYTNSHGTNLNTIQNCQAEAKSVALAEALHACDYEQHSPMSILEASFSNDSCLSESFNSSSGHRPYVGFRESYFERSLSRDLDTDLSDSATSSIIRRVESGKSPLFLDNISIIHNISSSRIGSSGSKINYIRDAISNAELLFGNISLDTSDGTLYSPIDPILLDTLEILVGALWEGPNSNLSHSETKDGFQNRRLVFDYIIEHLDVNYSHCCKMGYKGWEKLPLLTGNGLSRKIYEEIVSYRDQAGKILDEVVQKEISLMNMNWMDFQVEAFEAGTEIENSLLQLLVDEIVFDLLWC